MVRGLTAAVAALAMGAVAAAQTRGISRIAGKVVDESGQPIEGVVVKATLGDRSDDAITGKSNRKGEWAVGGLAGGSWSLDFTREGYEPLGITVPVGESGTVRGVDVVLKKAAPVVDPNVEIKDGLTKAAALMNQKQFADARAIYEALLAKYPQAYQIHPLIARSYYGEKNNDKAIEHLRLALEQKPDHVEWRLLLGNTLVEKGEVEEGKKVLASIDPAQITDPLILVNVAIALINQSRAAEAVAYLDQAIARFPSQPDAYYYRGITFLQLAKSAEAKADLEKFVSMAPLDAPELPMAKKILEQIK